MCRYEMLSKDTDGPGLVKKLTGWMANSPYIARAVSLRCPNDGKTKVHRHVILMGGRAKACQVYPPKLVKAILKGFVRQLRADGKLHDLHIGAICCEEVPDEAGLED